MGGDLCSTPTFGVLRDRSDRRQLSGVLPVARLSVAAAEPGPQAEAALRRFVAASWPALVQFGARQPLPNQPPETCETSASYPPLSRSRLFPQNLPDARLAKYNDLDIRSWTLAPVPRTAAERIA
jgi:hypothetical protein